MKYINQIPAAATILYTNDTGQEVTISTLHVSCGNTAGASFYIKYIPKNGGVFFLTSKLFTPPQLSTWDYPSLPFRMQPGDSLQGSASDGTNYDLIIN